MRLLVVEDEAPMARLLRRNLEARDYHVAVAENGAAGLAQVAAYLAEIERGGMTKSGEPDIIRDTGPTIVWDGRYLPGLWLMDRAIGLALDCGPGWTIPDAIRLGRAVEPYNIMWIEDILTGDYVPWVNASAYREVTQATTTPVHTGEQIYLRHHFKELFEKQAVRCALILALARTGSRRAARTAIVVMTIS